MSDRTASDALIQPLGIERRGAMLVRRCPFCSIEIVYKKHDAAVAAARQIRLCQPCSVRKYLKDIGTYDDSKYRRRCPTCDIEIIYKSRKCASQANKANVRCKACADDATRSTTQSTSWRTARSERYRDECRVEGSPVSRALDALQNGAARCGGVSKPERAFVEALRPLGFLPQQKVGGRRFDAVNHETKVVVEFQGDWWHVRPGSSCEANIRARYNGIHPRRKITIEEVWRLDAVKHEIARRECYQVILIPENEKKLWLEALASLENVVE